MAALVPALMAAGKAAALGAAGGAASYGAKKGLQDLTRQKKKRRAATQGELRQFKRTLLQGNSQSLIVRRL